MFEKQVNLGAIPSTRFWPMRDRPLSSFNPAQLAIRDYVMDQILLLDNVVVNAQNYIKGVKNNVKAVGGWDRMPPGSRELYEPRVLDARARLTDAVQRIKALQSRFWGAK